MTAVGTVEAINQRKRLAAISLVDGKHAVVEWVGTAEPSEGDVVRGYMDSFGKEYLQDETQHRLIKANVRFLGCTRDVALSIIGPP